MIEKKTYLFMELQFWVIQKKTKMKNNIIMNHILLMNIEKKN